MSLPPVPPPVLAGPLNPLEAFIMSINTNTYVIGMMMIILNLGGRHLATGLTPEQDKLFQNPWARRSLLFVVIFIATRNIFTALWLSIGLVILIGYLLNEHSEFYLFGPPRPVPVQPAAVKGLTAEESDIYKKLHEKSQRLAKTPEAKDDKEDAALGEKVLGWYDANMKVLQNLLN
jgi:hypothetical protein